MSGSSEAIKAYARSLGFQAVGIARVEELREERSHLEEWLRRGYHGTMKWMENPKRRSVDDVLPGARSVVSVGMNYYVDQPHSRESGTGKISRYAWGDDYHEVLQERLKRLLERILELVPGERGKLYVDTGPVMEKAWAQRAGLGWIGKHTNLITQEFGSWVFLGEILLTAELEYDAPATDHCGTCTLCIEACPTAAITEPYVLDSNLCISYLTIEHRGPIPEHLAGQTGDWIYGCDICQDVCPWNHKFSQPGAESAFQPRPFNIAPDLEEWKSMSEEEFREKFSNSPIKRTKHAGLMRNISFTQHQPTPPAGDV